MVNGEWRVVNSNNLRMVYFEMEKEKKQIVFVNQSSGYLMLDIIDAFGTNYEERILMAGFINPRNKAVDTTIKVIKLATYNRSSSVKRLITWSLAFIKALWLIKTKYRKADLFLVSNPPFALFIPLFCNNPFRVLVYDVYPDAMVSYKLLKQDSWLAGWWRKANKKVFAKAMGIYTIGNGMKQLLSAYIDASKIKVVPIWTDNAFLKPLPKATNPFIIQQKLENKFIVLYSGNLGKTQEVEVLVELAANTTDSNLFFLIIGGGDKYQWLANKIGEKGLDNIRLLPWQQTDQLPYSLASADIAVVSLGKEASLLSVPSKTFNYLSVGAPLLCIASPDSELAILVKEHKIGECFGSSETDRMIAFINNLKNNQQQLAAFRERSLATSNLFSPANALEFIQ
jgi:glycosyltransferase involved in cell wall biosynthesis